jgi:polar amino acid transport system substrate-binding protein
VVGVSGCGFEGDLVAEGLEFGDQAAGLAFRVVAAGVEVGAEVGVRGLNRTKGNRRRRATRTPQSHPPRAARQEQSKSNDAAALSALETAAIDGAVFDQASAEQYAAENPGAKLKVVKSISTDIPHGFAFKKGNTGLIAKINDVLTKVIADGTW